jgi:hypothetical protein
MLHIEALEHQQEHVKKTRPCEISRRGRIPVGEIINEGLAENRDGTIIGIADDPDDVKVRHIACGQMRCDV